MNFCVLLIVLLLSIETNINFIKNCSGINTLLNSLYFNRTYVVNAFKTTQHRNTETFETNKKVKVVTMKHKPI